MSDQLLYQMCIAVLGVSWLGVYGMVIHRGFRDRSYGMPLIALCGNIAWEFQFAFITPYDAVLQAGCVGWFVLDLLVLWTALRFGPAQFPIVSRLAWFGLLALFIAMAYIGIALLAAALGSAASIYTGFGQTMLMSALFIAMAVHRGSLSGQSLAIGYTKWIGTAFGCVAYYFFDTAHSGIALIGYGGICIFILDGIYVATLYRLRRTGLGPQTARQWTEAPQAAPIGEV